MKKLILAVAVCLLLAGCYPEKNARDTAAALKGAIVAAQAQYQTECTANPNEAVCKTINRGVDAQNTLITAIQTYCGWPATQPPEDPNVKCVPVSSATSGLQAAIGNAEVATTEIKGVIKK